MTSLVVGILWLLHGLPLCVLARLGRGLGLLLYYCARQRRHIARVNLQLCFPDLSASAREDLLREHFQLLSRSVLERGVLWWASKQRLSRLIRVEGFEYIEEARAAGKAIIVLVPHFLGLDVGGVAISMRCKCVSIYSRQKNKVFDHFLKMGRLRFGDTILLSRQDGVRKTVKAMKDGRAFYYLPDMDYGRKDAIFVPFFGVEAATVTALPRLARLANAVVIPCVSTLLAGGEGYVVQFGPTWENFPGGELESDVARMNSWIEQRVRHIPAQYYWLHRRFKTRPHGQSQPY